LNLYNIKISYTRISIVIKENLVELINHRTMKLCTKFPEGVWCWWCFWRVMMKEIDVECFGLYEISFYKCLRKENKTVTMHSFIFQSATKSIMFDANSCYKWNLTGPTRVFFFFLILMEKKYTFFFFYLFLSYFFHVTSNTYPVF